jgi:hypothetical protein
MTLLTLIQDTSKAIGLESPTLVTSSQDKRVLELLVLANDVGDELATRYEWQELTRTASWSCTGTVAQGTIGTSTIASGFGRFIDSTFWDSSARLQIANGVTMQEWRADIAGQISAPPYKSIIINNVLYVGATSAPAAGNTLTFDYITRNWCQSSAGVQQSAFAADSDTVLIPERLFKLSLIWRWKQSKSLAYAEDLETAEQAIETYVGQNVGRRVLYIGGAPIHYFPANIPAGDWPSS